MFYLEFLGKELDDYVSQLSIATRVIRTTKRIGLIRARILGAKEANGQILTFLDAHCECTTGINLFIVFKLIFK